MCVGTPGCWKKPSVKARTMDFPQKQFSSATTELLRLFLAGNSHTLSNLVMDLDYALQEGKHTDLAHVLRVLRAHSLQMADLPLLIDNQTPALYRSRVDLAAMLRDVEAIMRVRFERVPCGLQILTDPA